MKKLVICANLRNLWIIEFFNGCFKLQFLNKYMGVLMVQTNNVERDKETFQIIGAAMRVHSELGCGFLEAVYQEALEKEFKYNEIPYRREDELPVYYRNEKLNVFYKADFICFENIIVELKAIKKLTTVDESQVINYLKASGLNKALLLNFGMEKLEYKRFIYTL